MTVPVDCPTCVILSNSVSLGLDIGRVPKNFVNAGVPTSGDEDVADCVGISISHLRYVAKFGHSRPNCSIVTMEICQKILTYALHFKVTQGHWNRHGSIGHL